VIASEKLAGKPKKKDVVFYEGQVKTADFFIGTMLPTTLGKMNSILGGNDAVNAISEDAFGGK